jgi:hypothetical protein
MNNQNPKISDMTNRLIDRLMAATGMIAMVYILTFLLVAMIDK